MPGTVTTEQKPKTKKRGRGGLSDDPEKRARQLAGLRPWRPGQSGNPKGPNKAKTMTETLRGVVDGEVPEFLVESIRKRLKLTPDTIRSMTLRDVIACKIVMDYIQKDDPKALDTFMDRLDPKQRRVQHEGEIGHKLLGMVLTKDMTENDAAELYKAMLEGGTVEVDTEGGEPG